MARCLNVVLGGAESIPTLGELTQNLPGRFGSHARTLEFPGGVPRQVVPDNWGKGACYERTGMVPRIQSNLQ
jgi:hypothetical protein